MRRLSTKRNKRENTQPEYTDICKKTKKANKNNSPPARDTDEKTTGMNIQIYEITTNKNNSPPEIPTGMNIQIYMYVQNKTKSNNSPPEMQTRKNNWHEYIDICTKQQQKQLPTRDTEEKTTGMTIQIYMYVQNNNKKTPTTPHQRYKRERKQPT